MFMILYDIMILLISIPMGHLCGHCKVMELSLSVLPGERH